jgi:hypothetical protein
MALKKALIVVAHAVLVQLAMTQFKIRMNLVLIAAAHAKRARAAPMGFVMETRRILIAAEAARLAREGRAAELVGIAKV